MSFDKLIGIANVMHDWLAQLMLRTRFTVVLLTVLLWGGGAAAQVLTQAVQVVGLSSARLTEKLPVRLQGVILSGKELGPNVFMMHDGTAVIYVRVPKPPPGAVARSNIVKVVGTVLAGGFAPGVEAAEIEVVGKGPMPEAQLVTYDQLFSGGVEARWVEVRGVVRSGAFLRGEFGNKTVIGLATGGGRLVVEVAGRQMTPEEWVDSEARFRGICFYQYNLSGQLYDVVVVVPQGELAVKQWSPGGGPFSGPPVPIGSILQFAHQGSYGHRIHVEGVVLFQQPGEFLYIHDGKRGLYVRTIERTAVTVGSRVGVAGFVVRGDYSPMLEDAVYRELPGQPPAVKPTKIEEPARALALDTELVTLDAVVVGHVQQEDGWALSLKADGMVFNAFLRTAPGARPFPDLPVGTEVNLTGICTVMMGYWVPQGGLRIPQSFRLLLRSADDLRVLHPPPWWTRTRVVVALAMALVIIGLMAGGISLFARRRLRQQKQERRQAEAEFAAILNERNRMAREIHDTLAQDLSAVSAQLEMLRTKLPPGGEEAQQQIENLRGVVRGSLAEARRSIFNMRSQVLENGDLPDALRGLVANETKDKAVAGTVSVEGAAWRLSPALENDLLRIGQEAIHNAMRHGAPRTLKVLLRFSADNVLLAVQDDGHGFEPQQVAQDRETHFGLLGMQERACRHGAELKVDSGPGRGTVISLEVPLK